ncbi:unnamed protein product [Amaranthus hypochondriacus]
MQSVLPFDKWGIDLLGPFPPAKGQRKFIIVAIDYFSKYVEAEPLSTITEKQVCKFLWRNIITRYGIPRVIITDNGRQFISRGTVEYCERFNIQNRFSLVSRPQTCGQVQYSVFNVQFSIFNFQFSVQFSFSMFSIQLSKLCISHKLCIPH